MRRDRAYPGLVVPLRCGQARKPEARNPKPERRPKAEVTRGHALALEGSISVSKGCQAALRWPKLREGWRAACRFRSSGFSPAAFARWKSRTSALLHHLLFLLLVSCSVCFGQRQNDLRPAPLDPVQAAKEARALVAEMLAQRPDQNATNTGLVTIRDAAGKEREIPVQFDITATPTNWASSYRTLPSPAGPGGLKLTVIHSDEQPNRYELFDPAAAGGTNAATKELTPGQLMMPFAGSDFWIADLGLEFLHWPKQRLLRKEMRHSKSCDVLESTNPAPGPGGYARVVSWIMIESPHGIVHADAYDARGEVLKRFDPKSLEKVQGEYQLEEMEMRNPKTDSRTVIKFNLAHK
jgi:Outer membrane lipoprotein-sorting protein